MFIEQIRLENLASLKGLWTIDFTVPEYENGLFAVTGTNGAGKSTLMDAICLALYGKTSRLTFSQKSNEIMTKGTAFCSSEIIFRTAEGRFRVKWSQERTRRGKEPFSAAKREFTQINGEACAKLAKEVDGYVKKYVGLNFEQFTQSAMLAQFKFEKFLSAKASERTEILEALTGTEHFKKLVDFAQKLRNEKGTEVTALENQKQGKTLRTQEEMAQKEKERQVLEAEKEENCRKTNAWNAELVELRKWNELQEQFATYVREQAELNREILLFQPEKTILEKGIRARNVSPHEEKLAEARKRLLDARNDWEEREKNYGKLLLDFDVVKSRKNCAEKEFKEKTEELKCLIPTLEKVRQLDKMMANISLEGKKQGKELENAQNLRQSAENDFNEINRKLMHWKETLRSYLERLPENERSSEAVLTGNHPILRNFEQWAGDFSRLNEILKRGQEFQKKCREVEPKLKEAKSDGERIEEALKSAKEGHATILEALETPRKERQKLLSEQTKQGEYSALCRLESETMLLIENLRGLFEKYALDEERIKGSKKAIFEKEAKSRRLAEAISERTQALSQLNDQREELEKLLVGIQVFKNFEDARAHLHAGKPCPLCGALEHPFSALAPGNGLKEEKQKEELEKRKTLLEKELADLKENRERLISDLAETNGSLKALEIANAETISLLKTNWLKFKDNCRTLGFAQSEFDDSDKNTDIETLQTVFERRNREIAQNLTEREKRRSEREHRLKELDREIETLEIQKLEIEGKISEIEQEKNKRNVALASLEENYSVNRNDFEQTQDELQAMEVALKESIRKILSNDWSNDLPNDLPNDLSAILLKRRETARSFDEIQAVWHDVWKFLREKKELLEKIQNAQNEVKSLEDRMSPATRLLTERRVFEKEKAARLDELRQDYATQSRERKELLQTVAPEQVKPDPEQIQQKKEKEIQDAEDNLKRLQEQYEAFQKAEATEKANLTHLQEETLPTLRREEERFASEFQRTLQEERFADEEEYGAAKQTEDELERLNRQVEDFKRRQNALDGKMSVSQKELEKFDGKAPSEKSEHELENHIREISKRQEEVQSELGKIEQIFTEEKRLRGQIDDLEDRIQEKRREAGRWNTLCETLGAVSGTKTNTFVNFVHSITFNNLLYYANRQLKLLNPRYALKTSAADPNGLLILDSMHDSVERSPSSLSGGETFTLSLALALGLTKIASRNIEINSFFIDEGFGSLATETLENALDALRTYQANARRSGKKLIGVISHVAAVQNEIETVVELIPYAPHRFSRIVGPGVSGSEKISGGKEKTRRKKK